MRYTQKTDFPGFLVNSSTDQVVQSQLVQKSGQMVQILGQIVQKIGQLIQKKF